MKLQKQVTRKIGDKKYSKYVVTIAPDDIKKLGWGTGQELELSCEGKTAKLTPKEKNKKR